MTAFWIVAAAGADALRSAGEPTHSDRRLESSSFLGPQRPDPAVELGCVACHPGIPGSPAVIRDRAPSLAYAGRRYRRSYLFAYLQRPTRVRPHIGASRMPDFGLDERETTALTLYLGTLSAVAAEPRYPAGLLDAPDRRLRSGDGARLLSEDLGCLACHSLSGSGTFQAPDLADVGARLEEPWLRQYLAAPHAFDTTGVMPAAFYRWDRTAGALAERLPGAGDTLRLVATYLASLSRDRRRDEERAWNRARRRHRDLTAEQGERIFRALNCAGCHDHPAIEGALIAPDIGRAGERLRSEWLDQYLADPTPVRPFGFHPGTGARMPDFRLGSDEVAAIVARVTPAAAFYPSFAPTPLSTFSQAKAVGYLRDRLPCLGCHRLDGEGGRIGPDLSGVGRRLRPAYLRAMIADPGRAHPGTVMPRHPMPGERVDLLTSYLATRTDAVEERYPSLTEFVPLPSNPDLSTGPGLYTRYCAACHGTNGAADGYNAEYLPVAPTRHADSSAMAARPDDTLFDGIHAGGLMLSRSHRMPAFGETFSGSQTRALVAHIRRLCRCEQPEWSRW